MKKLTSTRADALQIRKSCEVSLNGISVLVHTKNAFWEILEINFNSFHFVTEKSSQVHEAIAGKVHLHLALTRAIRIRHTGVL